MDSCPAPDARTKCIIRRPSLPPWTLGWEGAEGSLHRSNVILKLKTRGAWIEVPPFGPRELPVPHPGSIWM